MSKESEVITFGCRLNIYESEIIKQDLKKMKILKTLKRATKNKKRNSVFVWILMKKI